MKIEINDLEAESVAKGIDSEINDMMCNEIFNLDKLRKLHCQSDLKEHIKEIEKIISLMNLADKLKSKLNPKEESKIIK